MNTTPSLRTSDVALTAGPASVQIRGGDLLSVTALRHGATELLTDPEDLPEGYRVHAQRAGITLLHPWANRLSQDSYSFDGRLARLDGAGARVSRDAHGSAIHGLRAPSPWRLVQASPSTAVASLSWLSEPGFPFAHQTVVSFALAAPASGEVVLRVHTRISALDADCVPVAFGWHPYFRHGAGATIELPDRVELGSDDTGLPTAERTPRTSARIALGDAGLDYGLSGLVPGAEMRLDTPGYNVTVACTEGYRFGQVFAPTDAPVVSLEPMTAPTDALVRGIDLPVATPAAPYVALFTVHVSERG